ncbi:MAG: PIG-L deacetylase family protein [Bacillota bacterium]
MQRRGSLLPWLVAAGSLAAAYRIWRDSFIPYYPGVALQNGLELLSRPRRVLAIGPHPDDLECFVGGTLKLLTLNGSAVTMAVLSRGEGATHRANIGEIRRKEAEEGATVLGAEIVQLSLPDGSIRPGPALEESIDQLWRRVEPDLVLAFDPEGPLPFGTNQDHLALGAAVLKRARGAVRHGTRVYFYASPRPNVLVDVTEVILEKTNALRAHRSQLYGPDWVTSSFVRTVSRLSSRKGPAIYTEGLFRLV